MNAYTLNLLMVNEPTITNETTEEMIDTVLERVNIYQNEFYSVDVTFGMVLNNPLHAKVHPNHDFEFLPTLEPRFHEGRWECLIHYKGIDITKETSSDELANYIQQCQHGEVTSNAIVELLNSLETEYALATNQRIIDYMTETAFMEMFDHIETGDKDPAPWEADA